MPSHTRSSLVETLESRLLYARTPADVRPDSLGRAFDVGERKALLGRLGNMPTSTYGVLSRHLKAGRIGAFDDRLLAYMRDRPGTHYFFDESEAGSIATYTKNNLNIGTQIEHADAVTDDRLFPEQSSSTRYTVQLPSRINWKDASRNSNPEFIYALNRQEWWVDLAQSYRYTGNAKYMNELQYELASWSQQNESFTLPDNTGRYTSYGFDTAIRVDDWIMSYFSVLGSSGWTGAANSLMLYKLVQQGDVLNTVATNTTDFTSNRSTIIGKTATMLGFALPEADTAPRWRKNGRELLFNAMDAQLYADGSHREQSPGYALNVLDNVLEAREIDKIHGVEWPTRYLTTAVNAVDALWQQLSPNGKRPSIGDTYRLSGNGQFTKAALALDITRWPEGKANSRDAWIFGTTAVGPYKHDTENDLANRGSSAAFPDSGNYVMRSGNGDTARQINFTAGPKGGVHGHYNYMGFELSGYGRPLIADPGAYIYDESAAREWVTSAAAHNTVSVTGVNPAELQNNNDILVSGLQSVAGGTMISASYNGYQFLDGNPTLSRSLWYDGNNTIVIIDFASASEPTSFETGFTLEGQNTGRDLTQGTIYTRNSSGGNVRIQSLLGSRQSASIRTKGVFTSPTPSDLKDPATRYYASQSKSTFAVFATVITASNGSAASAVNNVTWQRTPTKAGQTAILNVNGQSITFAGPQFAQVGRGGQTRGTYNDIAYDEKGRLHMAFYDRDTRTLKYALRNTNGVWGSIQTIDGQQDVGLTPSLVIDSENRPHVAYQDAGNGDLRYAYVSDETEAWVVQTVDVKGSTGAYPSLQLSRKGGAMIAYYNKTNGDLRLATSDTGGFKITTIDSRGDVGRFASLQLDPNRPTASKAAVAYEDTTKGTFKYAIQAGDGYKFETIDGTTKEAGGYVSMRFYDAGETFEPVATYYDAANGHLKYAARGDGTWRNTTIASGRRQGLYSQLAIVKNTPRVFFYDGRNNDALYLSGSKIWGGRWSQTQIADGGREIHYAMDGRGRFAFTSLDERTGFLTVGSV
ncbi:MAG TPA: heparinase II/III family protein [Tepidisphaeraceae bacterium]|jgi:hypothetical protein